MPATDNGNFRSRDCGTSASRRILTPGKPRSQNGCCCTPARFTRRARSMRARPPPTSTPSNNARASPSLRRRCRAPGRRPTGRLVMVRLYSGTLRKGDRVFNPRTRREDRVGRLVRMHADRREEITEGGAGEIVAVVGLRGFATGDTLCSAERPLLLEPPSFPEPVVSMAIEPRRSTESQRLGAHLQMLSEDDPTFHVSTHAETGQTLIAGMGELHLEVVRERLRTEFGLETNVGAPEIAYRETITAEAEADHLLKKQSGGSGMYARVVLAVRPAARGAGVTIENRVTGGSIPSEFHAAVRKGIQDAARNGVLGFTLVDAQVCVLDGAAHVK